MGQYSLRERPARSIAHHGGGQQALHPMADAKEVAYGASTLGTSAAVEVDAEA